jgi:hypothetical protein
MYPSCGVLESEFEMLFQMTADSTALHGPKIVEGILDQKTAVKNKEVLAGSGWSGLIATVIGDVRKIDREWDEKRQGEGN